MTDREIAAHAMKWHAARERRLDVGRKLRAALAESEGCSIGRGDIRELEWRLAEFKRAERLALNAIRRACQQASSAESDVIDV